MSSCIIFQEEIITCKGGENLAEIDEIEEMEVK
jgi:hypothetical protein